MPKFKLKSLVKSPKIKTSKMPMGMPIQPVLPMIKTGNKVMPNKADAMLAALHNNTVKRGKKNG